MRRSSLYFVRRSVSVSSSQVPKVDRCTNYSTTDKCNVDIRLAPHFFLKIRRSDHSDTLAP